MIAEDPAELDQASTRVKIVGDRYPDAMQQMINREVGGSNATSRIHRR